MRPFPPPTCRYIPHYAKAMINAKPKDQTQTESAHLILNDLDRLIATDVGRARSSYGQIGIKPHPEAVYNVMGTVHLIKLKV